MKNILNSVFKNYGIEKVILVKESDFYNFIISDMNTCISIEKWEYLENILKDITKKEINLIPYNQAIKYFGNDYACKGEIIR